MSEAKGDVVAALEPDYAQCSGGSREGDGGREVESGQVDAYEKLNSWKMCAYYTQQDAKNIDTEVGTSTTLSPMLTSLLQELTLPYLKADV